jgi:hypothetical protein
LAAGAAGAIALSTIGRFGTAQSRPVAPADYRGWPTYGGGTDNIHYSAIAHRADRTFSLLSANVSLALATSRLAFRVAGLRADRTFSLLSSRIPVRGFINYPSSLKR